MDSAAPQAPELITPATIVRGTEVAYYLICPRKLWLFSHGIRMEPFSDTVYIGKLLSQMRFPREKYKEVEVVEGSKFDFIKFGDEIIIHEVKKSRKLDHAHKLQVKFYIYQLRRLGINCRTAVLHYPKAMRKEEVELSPQDERAIENAIGQIRKIKSMPAPPPAKKKGYCRSCAYYEFCFI